jgi:hypothetical protein
VPILANAPPLSKFFRGLWTKHPICTEKIEQVELRLAYAIFSRITLTGYPSIPSRYPSLIFSTFVELFVDWYDPD